MASLNNNNTKGFAENSTALQMSDTTQPAGLWENRFI